MPCHSRREQVLTQLLNIPPYTLVSSTAKYKNCGQYNERTYLPLPLSRGDIRCLGCVEYMKMRVLIANTLYPTESHPFVCGGAERSVKILATELAKQAHDVHVLRMARDASQAGTFREEEATVHSLKRGNLYDPFSDSPRSVPQKALWHLIDDWHDATDIHDHLMESIAPDLVHTNNLAGLGAGVWIAAAKRNIPILHTLRDYSLMCPRATLYKRGRLCTSLCVECRLLTLKRRQHTALVTHVTAISQATLDLHLKENMFPNAKYLKPVGNPVSGTPLPTKRQPGEPCTFGFIGRLSEEKGVFDLIKVFARLEGNHKLVLAGRGTPREQARVQNLCAGLDVTFLGFVDPNHFYEQVDVTVVPSLWPEPLSRTVLESIACGRPVIGSNRGGIPEAMGDPPYGLLYDPDEKNALHKTMSYFVNNALSLKKRTSIDTVSEYIAIYSSIIDHGI